MLNPRRLRILWLIVLMPAALLLPSCGRGGHPPAAVREDNVPRIPLSSPEFAEGAPIPARFTCDGANVSPPLRWGHTPRGAKSLVLVCDDPDAPDGDWTHWVLYDLPATAASVPEAVSATATLPDGARQVRNSFGRLGYGGPCPSRGSRHRYFFRLYVLDNPLSLPVGATAADARQAMHGHVLAEGTLMGVYQRP